MMWWNQAGEGNGQWLVMGVMMLLVWAATIALLARLIRWGRSTRSRTEGDPTTERAGQLLAERFGRGEIDEAQFIRARTLLRSQSSRS